MKLIKLSGIFLASILVLTGCKKDWLDVNDDPETTSAVDPEFLLYGAQTEFSANRTSEIGLSSAMWSQMWASGSSASVFLNPERYIFSSFTLGNTWRTHYPNSQKNLRFAIEIAESSDPAQPNIAAQARVMRALIFYTTTILWGDVPYSEALDESIAAPKFDAQEDVLNGVLADLDLALAGFNPTDPNVANDHYYSGDINKWIALAKSLKFRTLMTMVDADPSKASDITTMLAEGGMIGAGGDANYPFQNQSGNFNPNWNVLNQFAGGQNLFYFASKTTVNTMEKYNDPRINIYYDKGPDTTLVVGVEPGTAGDYGTDALLSLNVIQPDAPERVFTYTEQLFLEAEAEYRFGSIANAQTKLEAAITNSMNKWGVASEDITTYLAGLSPLAILSNDDAIRLIAEQAWIAFIDKPLEAWTNWRRNEYPELIAPSGATLADFVRRLPYPPDELSANTNAPANPSSDTKLWFDK